MNLHSLLIIHTTHLLLHALGPKSQNIGRVDAQVCLVEIELVAIRVHHADHHIFELGEARADHLLLSDPSHDVLRRNMRRHVAHEILQGVPHYQPHDVPGELVHRTAAAESFQTVPGGHAGPHHRICKRISETHIVTK
jgi:hypothetical protein